MTDIPADFYREKDELARALREAIKAMEQVQKLEPLINYERYLLLLKSRLEQAEYVGD